MENTENFNSTKDYLPSESPQAAPIQPIDELIKSGEEKVKAADSAPLARKRGRPRKTESNAPAADAMPVAQVEIPVVVQAPPPTDYAPMIRDLACMGSGVLVEHFRTDAAALTQEEGDRLAIGLNPLLQKWFPEMGELSPEMTAVICCGSIAYAVMARVKAAQVDKDTAARAA